MADSKSRQVVTIDISNFEQRKHEIAAQLFEAAKNVGFFYISGQQADNAKRRRLRAAGPQFWPGQTGSSFPECLTQARRDLRSTC